MNIELQHNEKVLLPYIKKLYDKLMKNDLVISKTNKTTEVLNTTIYNLDPTQPILNFWDIRKTPIDYCKAELDWYYSMDLSVKEIAKHAKLWNKVADKNKIANSNYGYIIYSDNRFNQYEHCVQELLTDKYSRRAIMIYTTPEMWIKYNENGRQDFSCTNTVSMFIRNNQLIMHVQMRSNDLIYGFFNDFYWQAHVYMKIFNRLINEKYPGLEIGHIDWTVSSLHVYKKHFKMLEQLGQKILEMPEFKQKWSK